MCCHGALLRRRCHHCSLGHVCSVAGVSYTLLCEKYCFNIRYLYYGCTAFGVAICFVPAITKAPPTVLLGIALCRTAYLVFILVLVVKCHSQQCIELVVACQGDHWHICAVGGKAGWGTVDSRVNRAPHCEFYSWRDDIFGLVSECASSICRRRPTESNGRFCIAKYRVRLCMHAFFRLFRRTAVANHRVWYCSYFLSISFSGVPEVFLLDRSSSASGSLPANITNGRACFT